jgi:zinc transport system permease protein
MMWNELFLVPFLTGLCFAIVLPLLGAYLRLRDEWLSALAYSHVAAAGALLVLVFAVPPMVGGAIAAGLAALGKRFVASKISGGASYALLLLGGWAVSVLLAANNPLAERLGHALFDGQLYFSTEVLLGWVAVSGLVCVYLLRRLSRRLLLTHIYPDFLRARIRSSWSTQTGFDLLSALALALATMSMGVMGAFSLIFIPPWLAFRRAGDWRKGLRLAVAIAVSAYITAFMLALGFDQPFGPVLALVLISIGLLIA